jgi:hypothetical protein
VVLPVMVWVLPPPPLSVTVLVFGTNDPLLVQLFDTLNVPDDGASMTPWLVMLILAATRALELVSASNVVVSVSVALPTVRVPVMVKLPVLPLELVMVIGLPPAFSKARLLNVQLFAPAVEPIDWLAVLRWVKVPPVPPI